LPELDGRGPVGHVEDAESPRGDEELLLHDVGAVAHDRHRHGPASGAKAADLDGSRGIRDVDDDQA
jgi:hypothetical protein